MHVISTLHYDKSFGTFLRTIRLGFFCHYWGTILNIHRLFECQCFLRSSLFGLWSHFWLILLLFFCFLCLLLLFIRLETLCPIFFIMIFSNFYHKYKRLLEVDFLFIFLDMNKSFHVLSRFTFAITPITALLSYLFNLTLIICGI